MEPMRLQKFLARAGVASRRKCEELIASGRIAVNGSVVTELGTKVDPAHDAVAFDGRTVSLSADDVVVMLNKPAGFLTAMSDERGGRVVASLVPVGEFPGLFPIGRLDRDTTGLLLFTTDGELGHRLLHPSHNVEKRYVADVKGALSEEERCTLEDGVMLDDGMTAPAKCEVLSVLPDGSRSTVALTIHEGRKRQVRRMLAAVGHEVISLHRERVGGLSLGDLQPGEWRELSAEEVALLEAPA